MDNQIVHVYDRAPLGVGMDTVPQAGGDIEGEIAFTFAEPPEDGSKQELVYGAGTMTYVKPGVVYGYTVLRDARILISFDCPPGINYV